MMEKMLMEFKTVVAGNIRVERTRKKITQEELAEMVGITPYFLSKLENARAVAGIKIYIKIAAALQLQFLDLFCEKKSDTLSDVNALFHLLSECSDFEMRECVKSLKDTLVKIREG